MLTFSPARMRHRVTFAEKQRTQDANGVESFTWTDVAVNIPAEFKFLSGSERIASAQTTANYKARVTIYKNDSIDESMRMTFDGKHYDIVDILPDPTNEIYVNCLVRKYSD